MSARQSAPSGDILNQIAEQISHRLCAWRMVSATPDARIARIGVLRCEVHPRYRRIMRPESGFFAQENAVMVRLERDSEGALRWDGSWPPRAVGAGEHDIAHYLVSIGRIDAIREAIGLHEALSDAQRDLICHSGGVSFAFAEGVPHIETP